MLPRSSPSSATNQEIFMSALRTIAIAVLASATFVGAAYARDAVFSARLQAPVAEHTRVIANNAIWNCDGDTCRARVTHGANVRSCRLLARELNARVVAYGAEDDQLSADEIARCNGETAIAQAAN